MYQTLLYVSRASDPADLLSAALGSRWRVLHAADPSAALETLRSETIDVVAAEASLPAIDGSGLLQLVAQVTQDAARVLVGDHWLSQDSRPDAHLVVPGAAAPCDVAAGISRAAALRDSLGCFGLRALGRRSRPRGISTPGPSSRRMW